MGKCNYHFFKSVDFNLRKLNISKSSSLRSSSIAVLSTLARWMRVRVHTGKKTWEVAGHKNEYEKWSVEWCNTKICDIW